MRTSMSIKSLALASTLVIGGFLAAGSSQARAAGPGSGRGGSGGYHGGAVGHVSGFRGPGYYHGGGPGCHYGRGGWYRPYPYRSTWYPYPRPYVYPYIWPYAGAYFPYGSGF